MKTLNFKKPILAIIFLLAIFAGIGIVYSAAKEGKGIVKFLNGPTPSITNAFIDKEKYFPGDIMAITAETENALEVKAFVENEKGFNEVGLVVAASFNGKETWTGKWKVENSLNGKKYKLKIVASNKSGTAETVLEWEDPNPGHPWSQIDGFPADCAAGEYVTGLGASLICSATLANLDCSVVTNIGAAPSYVSIATCATDEQLIAGGSECAVPGGAFCGEPGFGLGVVHTSIPSGNSWVVDCYKSDLSGDTCSKAYAFCCKK
ncbi:hypothetical protein KJ854_05595 [Patescibacteria group bacterium]|nr:hypothetical protein [Patescibacteria group bacterium]MBU4141672.1 hypothetical protein [Patescibacteria group bacterium]